MFPDGKRYLSYVSHLKAEYGQRLQKLVIDAGFTCPNRDGTVGTGGCTFCDNAAFHPSYSHPGKSIWDQIDEGIVFHRERYRHAGSYLAYFQSFSNTYAPLEHLRRVYSEALSHPQISGIVIGTRPDCVDEEKLRYLSSLRSEGHFVAVEFGIESCYDETLRKINRGHDFDCSRRAVKMSADLGLPVCGHFILGLPDETRGMLLDQCRLINALPLTSVKFHQLQPVRGTVMEKETKTAPERFLTLSLPDYIDFIIDILERLRPDLCIERVAGEVPPRFVEKARWGLVRNYEILRMLDARLEERDTFQGRLFDVQDAELLH